MKTFIVRKYHGLSLRYEFIDGVIKKDYYKDHLVKQLHFVIENILKDKRKISVLDLTTGNGYTAIIIAKKYKQFIKKIVACDINPNAVTLAKRNAELNNCDLNKMDFRNGTMYQPLKLGERFDIIISALPPIPISGKELSVLPKGIRAHHWIKSTAGSTGRQLLDRMIKDAHKHLYPNGVVLTVQSDFQNTVKDTISVMKQYGLEGTLVGDKKPKKLKDTALTILRKGAIEKLGYTFTKDEDGDEQFFILVYKGRLANPHLI